MFDLSMYIPTPVLQLSWEIGKHYRVIYKEREGKNNFLVESHDPTATGILNEIRSVYGDKEASTTALQYRCLYDFMKSGPVIVRPSIELCLALADTEIRMSALDYKMAYPIIGIELPKEVVGVHYKCLTFVWRLLPEAVMVWTLSPFDLVTYHIMFGDDLPTLEDRLILQEGVDSDSDRDILTNASRIALNLGMLSAHRNVEKSPLPRNVLRQRQANNGRLRRLGLQQAQELIFRDLVLKEHGSSEESKSAGLTFGKQHRRGHWKRQPFGPKFSQRKWLWINDYWTHREDSDLGENPAIILS